MLCFCPLLRVRHLGPIAAACFLFGSCQLQGAALSQPGEAGGARASAALPLASDVTPSNLLPSIVSPSIVSPSIVSPGIATVEPTHPHANWGNRLWVTSLFAIAGATSADAATSWGYRESNGVLKSANGTFGARGVGIKLGAVAALLVPEILLRKHQDLRMKFAVGNFVEAGIFTGTSIYNVHAAATQTAK